MENTYLAHHGIKGQRWGIRRYQNKDGTLTSAGKKKKELTEIQKYRVNQYKKQYDLTDEEAEEAVRRRKKIAVGIVAGAGAIALATFVGTRAYQRGYIYADRTIKAGQTIQTLSYDADRLKKGETFYTNFLNADKNIYEGRFSGPHNATKFRIQAGVTKDIKVASEKTGRKVFETLLKEDSDFKKLYEQAEDRYSHLRYKRGYDLYNAKVIPDYDSIVATRLNTKFYNALKKQGYGGVIDVNDTRYSNLRGHSPTIIFDKSGLNLDNVSISKITNAEKDLGNAFADKAIPKLERRYVNMEKVVPRTTAYGTVILANALAIRAGNKVTKQAQNNATNRYVKEYQKRYGINLSKYDNKTISKIMKTSASRKFNGLTYHDYQMWERAMRGQHVDYEKNDQIRSKKQRR